MLTPHLIIIIAQKYTKDTKYIKKYAINIDNIFSWNLKIRNFEKQ